MRGLELGIELSPQQELLEEVTEANWLLQCMWQLVEGIWHQTWRLAIEMERTEVWRELQELQEEADGHHEEFTGSWRTDLEEPEEWSGEVEVHRRVRIGGVGSRGGEGSREPDDHAVDRKVFFFFEMTEE